MRDDLSRRPVFRDNAADDPSISHPHDPGPHGLVTPPEPVRPWRIVVFGGVGAVILGLTVAMLAPRGFPGAPDTGPAVRRTAAAATAPSPQFRAISGKYAAPDRTKILA